MRDTDFTQFTAMLDTVCTLQTRGTYKPNPESTAIFFRALQRFPIEAVRKAFDVHVQRSKFAPVPADLLEHLGDMDGRPSADEAWARALLGRDESATITWTAETAEAFAVAVPVLDLGDKVGARRAFIDAYERLVATTRAAGKPVDWRVSLGQDSEGRVMALHESLARGEIDEQVAIAYVPPADVPRLTDASAQPVPVPDRVREQLQRLRGEIEQREPLLPPEAARNQHRNVDAVPVDSLPPGMQARTSREFA